MFNTTCKWLISLCAVLCLISVNAQAPNITQQYTYHEALNVATAQNRTVLAYFWGQNCHFCEIMNNSVFPTPEVAGLLESHYTVASIDLDSEIGRQLAQGYRVNGTPTFVFVREKEGTWYEINRIIGGRSVAQFTTNLHTIWQQTF